MFRTLLKLTGLGLVATLATSAVAQTTFSSAHHDYRIVSVAEGLVQPWSMSWLPGGDMLVTEKPGRLRIVRDGQLLPEAVPGVPEVFIVDKVACSKSFLILSLMTIAGCI